MDDGRFDAMVRVLGAGAPRRRVLAGLLAGLPLAFDENAAARKKNKKKCKGGKKRCGKACRDLRVDPANCGFCGNACPNDLPACTSGRCEPPPCPDGLTRCEGLGCIDTEFNTQNCGATCEPCNFFQEACLFGVCQELCDPSEHFCQDPNPGQCRPGYYCFTSRASNATVCGQVGLASPCAVCEVDADCDDVTGPGSVCVDVDGFCFCEEEPNPTACIRPCGEEVPLQRSARASHQNSLRRE
jgi:hypothetical protein